MSQTAASQPYKTITDMLRLFFQNSGLKLGNPLLPVWSFCRTVKLDGVLLWKTSFPETANPQPQNHFYQISPWRQCDPWPLTTGFLPAELEKLKTLCACFFSPLATSRCPPCISWRHCWRPPPASWRLRWRPWVKPAGRAEWPGDAATCNRQNISVWSH